MKKRSAYRHKAVCGKQHGRGYVRELLLLVLPRRAEVALEVLKLAQLGIAVRGQHLAVGVYVYALALGLLKQEFQVIQVVAGDYDVRAFFNL